MNTNEHACLYEAQEALLSQDPQNQDDAPLPGESACAPPCARVTISVRAIRNAAGLRAEAAPVNHPLGPRPPPLVATRLVKTDSSQ